jgi:sugar transferase EpsL
VKCAGRLAKRILDFIASSICLICLIPILIIVGIVIHFTMGSPVVFRQMRPGLNAKPFFIYKFRTMTEGCDASGKLLSDEARLTGIGKWMRKCSIDELPQLWNVFIGDLSLVGPRPLLIEYLPLYSPGQARRHNVKPGITGWAQVNGRNAISWEEKFQLDVWYVDNWSFALDMKILLMTVLRVVSSSGINNPGHVTMPEFKGTKIDERNNILDGRNVQ